LNKDAKIYPFPSLMEIAFNCVVCHRAGGGIIYRVREEQMKKVEMYCETCKLFNKDSVNMDMSKVQELIGTPVFPTGEIRWENLRPVMK